MIFRSSSYGIYAVVYDLNSSSECPHFYWNTAVSPVNNRKADGGGFYTHNRYWPCT